MSKIGFKNNDNGASLLEVMIAMIILTVGFLGVIALAVALTNNNVSAGKINTATMIAQAEVSQINCLGITGVQKYFPQISPWTYSYIVGPTVSNPDNRNSVTSCINPALAVGGQAPDSPAPAGLGITLPYTVTINFANNLNSTSSTTVINARVEVSWRDTNRHVIVMNDIIS
ncbi:type IV pilus modification PilV family protein [Candidatus Acidulodesulfobacterium sp. H_13]|uniref:type IV pilus modification PilV family protein n=1 Tax=Candidatus Acidulodesulfobacterium sp. H_13 TaxID=3395470 RepID=UPI003AF4263F